MANRESVQYQNGLIDASSTVDRLKRGGRGDTLARLRKHLPEGASDYWAAYIERLEREIRTAHY